MRARHERRHLLVPRLDELHLVAGALQGAQEAVDAVSGISVDPVNPPRLQAFHHEVTGRFAHGTSPRVTRGWGLRVAMCELGASTQAGGYALPAPVSSRGPGATRGGPGARQTPHALLDGGLRHRREAEAEAGGAVTRAGLAVPG